MQRKVLSRLLAACLYSTAALNVAAQGTAFSYQGQLNVSGVPANTNYGFRFGVFDAPTNGTLASVWLTNAAVPVSNGLFSVILDFGPGVFNGTANGSNDWLDIGVRPVGAINFTTLAPRQPILPVPYALFATSASNVLGTVPAAQIAGTISSSLISGTYSNGVSFANGTNSFTGRFSGNGSNLTNLNASQIASGTLADARLASDVALLDQNQTFTGANIFNGTNIFTASNSFTGPNSFAGANSFSGINQFANNGNSFFGSFFGNGLVGWLPVYSISTNAMRDAGYLLLNAGLTTLTLPATASLFVGDIVRVSGGGGGGWLVKENSGQSIIGNFATFGNGNLTTLSAGGNSGYNGVAASSDGVHIFAVGGGVGSVNGFTGIYASSDSGRNWSQVGATYVSGYCSSVACSANGKIVYVQFNNGTLEKSADGGLTWTNVGTGTVNNFISCTADGSTLIINNAACSGNGTYRAKLASGAITISTNGGSSFAVTVPASPSGVTCLAVSSDCTKLVAGVSNGLLYASSNLGQSWTPITTTNQFWSGAWMSADGSKLAATVGTVSGVPGGLYSAAITPLPNTASTTSSGSIGGSQGSAVELQYLGGGQFMPVGATGLLWAN